MARHLLAKRFAIGALGSVHIHGYDLIHPGDEKDLHSGPEGATLRRVSQAESGSTILITRHNEPVAQLSPARPQNVHRGRRVGGGRILPALARGTRGRYLAVLMADRGER